MDPALQILLASALSIGVLHTLVGPDHYLPFIVLGRAEGWSLRKTLAWTAVCGLAHVLSSILLGTLGIGAGWAVGALERFEGVRGDVASWSLMGFGLVYCIWGLWSSHRHPHVHRHVHEDGSVHAHPHQHSHPHPEIPTAHDDAAHDEADHVAHHRRTVWTLFIIFALGPCEPLIPLLLYPAARHSVSGIATVGAVFSAATVGTMLLVVAVGWFGLRFVGLRLLERHAHALAGFAILVSGVLVKAFGL